MSLALNPAFNRSFTPPLLTPALTSKGQVTIPKAIREFLGVKPGSRLQFERLDDGRVVIAKDVKKVESEADCPWAKFVGAATVGWTTEELMVMTRGEDWNRP